MSIGAISLQPFLYNTNYINANSLGRIGAIGQSLDSRTDYSSIISGGPEENPLRKGETKGFMDILAMQLQMGQQNATRLVGTSDLAELNVEEIAENAPDADFDDRQTRDMPDMEKANQASAYRNVSDTVSGIDTVHTVQGAGENGTSGMTYQMGNMEEINAYRINRAINSYEAWMCA